MLKWNTTLQGNKEPQKSTQLSLYAHNKLFMGGEKRQMNVKQILIPHKHMVNVATFISIFAT